MGMNFPDAPTLNQVFQNYTWDGEKWAYSAVPTSAAPSNANPAMDGAAAPGVAALYSRGDHVHPSDTSRIAKAGDTMTGALTLNADPAAPLQAATKNYVDLNSMTQAAADVRFVNVTGDTMTGPLIVDGGAISVGGSGQPVLAFVSTGSAAGKQRMTFNYDGGAALGSPGIVFQNQADAGGFVSNSGVIWRDGSITAGDIAKPPSVGGIMSVVAAATGTYYFGNSGTKQLNYDGSNFNFSGGAVVNSNGPFVAVGANGYMSAQIYLMTGSSSPTGGCVYFGANATKYLNYDGTNFNLVGGQLLAANIALTGNISAAGVTASSTIISSGPVSATAHLMTQGGVVYFNAAATAYMNYGGSQFGIIGGPLSVQSNVLCAGHFAADLGYLGQAGVSGSRSGNRFNIEYVSQPHLWINGADLGQFAFASDYRVKKDVIDLDSMWDTVKALRPIKYTQAEFQPPSQKKLIAAEIIAAKKQAAEAGDNVAPKEIDTSPMFKADDIERWGFIAHELQATLTESAATGVKDDEVAIQSPNPFTIIAALTKALQEAMARIEALEQKVAPVGQPVTR